MAEFLYATSHLAGDFTNPDNALGNTPTTWAGQLNTNTSQTSRWAVDDPIDPLTDSATQTIRVVARKGSNSGTPTVALNLYENGTLVSEIVAATNITSGTGQTLTGTFNTSAVTNRADVEIEVVMTAVGGSPSARNSAQISHIEWEAETSVAAPSASGGSSTSIIVSTAGAGAKTGSGGAGSVVTAPTAGGGAKATSNGADATVTVTATGGGQVGSEDKSGGSATTVNVMAAGDGHKATSSGSAVTVTTSTAGDGEKTGSGGADSNITVDVTGGGQGSVAGGGGSSTVVTVGTTGDGTKAASGGSEASVTTTATGGGETETQSYNGGSVATVVIISAGDGRKVAAGGAETVVLIAASAGFRSVASCEAATRVWNRVISIDIDGSGIEGA